MPTFPLIFQRPYRDFVAECIRREFAQRHRGALLGRAWVVIQPLSMILIYTFVFSRVMHSRLAGVSGDFAYSVFLCAGLLPWGFFAETLQRCQNAFLDHAQVIKKTALPYALLPLVGAGIALCNFLLVAGLFLAFLAVMGLLPGAVLLAALPVLLLQTLMAAGLGVALGVVNVFFRDAGHVAGMVLQFGFWFTPVIYPLSVIPEWAREWVLLLNPMAAVVGAYQNLFLHGTLPTLGPFLPALLWCALAWLVAWRLLRRRGREMVDLL